MPSNAICETVRSQVVELATGKYAGFNDSHLHENFVKAEGVVISRPSVRRILRKAGIRSPQKGRAAKYRSRRERRTQEGMLLQLDGTRHDWLEGRGPYLTLLGGGDDATNKIYAAHFQSEHEDSAGYLRLFRSQVETVGIPWAIYRDQHGTLQRNDKHWLGIPMKASSDSPDDVEHAIRDEIEYDRSAATLALRLSESVRLRQVPISGA